MKHFLLVDDHEIVRSGVNNVLSELYKPCRIAEAHNEKTAYEQLARQAYDLVIMDVQMPDSDSLGLMAYIRKEFPATRVLMFSMSLESVYGKRFMKAGARGFVSKSAGLGELRKAIDMILLDKRYISSEMVELLTGELDKNKNIKNPFDKLSTREFEVMELLIQGKTATDISKLLSINTSTTATHKARLMAKLNVTNIIELSNAVRELKKERGGL